MKRKACIAMSIRMLWIPQVSEETWTKCSSSPSAPDVISLPCCSRAASSLPLPQVSQGSFGMDWGHISLLPFQGLPETQQACDSLGSSLQHLQRACWMVEGAHLN